MAQGSLTRIVSEAMRSGARCTRALHESAAAKKPLHNTESVVGLVADSMGRSRVKLTASDVERNGLSRVGPTTDVLHQVQRTGELGSAAEPPLEEKSGYVMTDPNSSMWNLCKVAKDSDSAPKKLAKRLIKMKDNIKQYYLDRLEENQVLFTEVEEPLRITKIDKRDRNLRYRDEEYEQLPQAQVLERPRKLQKTLFNQLQNKPEEAEAVKTEEYTEPVVKGYRKFNKLDLRKSQEDSVDAEGRSGRMKVDERVFVEQERSFGSGMWKRPQVKQEKEMKESRDGGFSEVPAAMSPAVHFKFPKSGGGIFNTIKSGDLIQGFFRRRIAESRNFSTQNPRTKDSFDQFKPVPLMLQREIASHCRHKRLADGKLIGAHSISTCSRLHSDDPCRPSNLPPQKVPCDPCPKLPKCPKPEEFEWPCCEKITLCGCDPVNPRINLPNCGLGVLKPFVSMAKRPEYICPSFSECARKTEMNTKTTNECCIKVKKPCDNFVGPRKPFITAIERQEISLGQKYWTGQKQQCCGFHSLRPRWTPNRQSKAGLHVSALRLAEEECDRPAKGQLPCQRTFNIPGVRKKEKYQGKGSCEKLCMPCCEPARDPPECLSIYQKPPCTKFKNPRPSFSECRKKFPFRHTMCECEVPAKPRCDQKKKNSESTC